MSLSKLVSSCAIVTLIAINIAALVNLNATNEVKTAVEESEPSVSQTYNTYEYYEQDNSQELNEIKDELDSIKEEIITERKTVTTTVVQQPTIAKEPWRGPNSYACNKMAGYPAICGYCGEQGEIHYNIIEWKDTQGTYHLTHLNCLDSYCNKNNVYPRTEEVYKLK